jgi:hypothetical protein
VKGKVKENKDERRGEKEKIRRGSRGIRGNQQE